MAFGQSSGPPASGRKLQELLELLNDAGHTDFRDARGPMGFTQRQAGGKFTAAEADDFIEQLQDEVYSPDAAPAADEPPDEPTQATGVAKARLSKAEQALRAISDEQLAAELQRRGWIVVEP